MYSIFDLPATTYNMVSKGKQVRESDSLDSEFYPELEGAFIKPKGMYQYTQNQKEVAIPLDQKLLARGSDEEDSHSTMVSSFSSNSIKDSEVMVNMGDLPDEVSQRLEKQEQQLKQQQESIEETKQLLTKLFACTRKINFCHIHSIDGKEKQHVNEDEENKDEHEEPPHHYDEEKIRFVINPYAENMKSQLQALLYRKEFHEVRIVRPYPIEWETSPYPSNYKPLNIPSFDGKGSLQQLANKTFDGA